MFVKTLIPNDGDEILRTAVDEAPKGIAHTWNGVVVEPHHHVSEGDEHEEVHKLRHVEAWAALSGRQRLLYAEPHQHNRGKRDADVETKCINRRGRRGGQRIASLSNPVQYSHDPPRSRESSLQ